jgi:hypothetical protein
MPADGLLVAGSAEITGERLLADHVLASLHAGDDHLGVEGWRRADVDDVDLRVTEKRAPIAVSVRDAEPACEVEHVVAARDDGTNLRVDPENASIGMHMQLRDEAAADHADPNLLHARFPSWPWQRNRSAWQQYLLEMDAG